MGNIMIVRRGGSNNGTTPGSSIPVFSYTGEYILIDDGQGKWRVKFLTSGTVMFENDAVIDVFLVGGGGAGVQGGYTATAYNSSPGGGGAGYTATYQGIIIQKNKPYEIVIGSGGVGDGSNGESTIAFNLVVGGGEGGDRGNGGSGGSGGGSYSGVGGSDGSNGPIYPTSWTGGLGQGTTTREFGEADGTIYAYGGNGSVNRTINGSGGLGSYLSDVATSGQPNTGSGGGGGADRNNYEIPGSGGSGIVVIRNRR